MNAYKLILALLVLGASVYARPLLLIMDASGSMDETLESNKTKLETAKEVAINTINGYGDEIALMVYTDCDSSGDPYSGSIRVWVNFTTDKALLRQEIESITASYSTPIARAVNEGTAYIRQAKGTATMVVLTDGEETCDSDSDVVSAIQSATSGGMDVSVVGFALDNSSQASLSSTVTQGGAKYYNAKDKLQLQSALTQAIGGANLPCCGSLALLAIPLAAAFYIRMRKQ